MKNGVGTPKTWGAPTKWRAQRYNLRRRFPFGLSCFVLSEDLSKLCFLLGREIRRYQLGVQVLKFRKHFVNDCVCRHEKERRRPGCDLIARFLDKVIVDPVIRESSGYCTHGSSNSETEKREKEKQTKKKTPKRHSQGS